MLNLENDDPLTLAMRPPRDESPDDRTARVRAEAEATRRSQLIDHQLRGERAQLKKESEKVHKILLLGMCNCQNVRPANIRHLNIHFYCGLFRPGRKWEDYRYKESVNISLGFHLFFAVT